MNTQKKAMIVPALIGGGIGAMASPEGKGGLGFAHGAARGLGTDMGIGLGGLTGGVAGLGLGGLLSEALPADSPYRGAAVAVPTIAGALLGGGVGGYGGYHAGAGVAKSLTGKKAPWQTNKKKSKPAETQKDPEANAKAAAFQRQVSLIVNDPNKSLSEKAAAVKAAVGAYHDPRAAVAAPPVSSGGKGSGAMTDDYMRFPVGDPNRTWKEWWDGNEDDLTTSIGIKKSPEYLAQNIRYLENAGRMEDAARLRAALPKGYDPNTNNNPYTSLAEDRAGMKPVAGPTPAAPPAKKDAPSSLSPALLYGGGGALGGAALGAMASRKNRLRNAIIGAALGGGGGLLANHLMSGGAGKTAAEKQALVGTTLGAVGGLATGEKGKRTKSTIRGALKGLGTDIGAVGGTLGGAVLGLPFGGIGAIPGALAGGIGGGYLGNKMVGSMLGPYKSDEEKQREQMMYFMELQKKMRESNGDSRNNKDEKEASLKDMQNSFFEAQREIGNRWNALPEGVRSGLGMGGIGGAALGGLAGLVAPGHEDVHDEYGNVVGRKRRSRFGAMARGVLGGGAAGLAAGGAAGYFAPEHTKSVMNNIGKSVGDMQQYGRGLYDRMFKPRLTATPQLGQPGQMPYGNIA